MTATKTSVPAIKTGMPDTQKISLSEMLALGSVQKENTKIISVF